MLVMDTFVLEWRREVKQSEGYIIFYHCDCLMCQKPLKFPIKGISALMTTARLEGVHSLFLLTQLSRGFMETCFHAA